MEIIQRMNKKLDVGWKLTNSNCEKCNGVTLADPSNITQYYCPKCDKILVFKQQMEQETQNENQPSPTYHENKQQEQDYFNEVLASTGMFSKKEPQTQTTPKSNAPQPKQSLSYQRKQDRSKNVSKKLGQKLLQGWTMLEQSCGDCNVPLMKSRRGQKLCLGCDKDYAAIQAGKQNKPTVTKIEEFKIAPSKQVPAQNKYPGQSKLTPTTTIPSQQQPITLSPRSPSSNLALVEAIECKALRFLQFKMDKAIDENDIGAVEKILSIIQSLKKL